MTVLLANLVLAIPFLAAFIAVPLWMTFARPETGPDHTQARQYLNARAAHNRARTRAAHTTAA